MMAMGCWWIVGSKQSRCIGMSLESALPNNRTWYSLQNLLWAGYDLRTKALPPMIYVCECVYTET